MTAHRMLILAAAVAMLATAAGQTTSDSMSTSDGTSFSDGASFSDSGGTESGGTSTSFSDGASFSDSGGTESLSGGTSFSGGGDDGASLSDSGGTESGGTSFSDGASLSDGGGAESGGTSLSAGTSFSDGGGTDSGGADSDSGGGNDAGTSFSDGASFSDSGGTESLSGGTSDSMSTSGGTDGASSFGGADSSSGGGTDSSSFSGGTSFSDGGGTDSGGANSGGGDDGASFSDGGGSSGASQNTVSSCSADYVNCLPDGLSQQDVGAMVVCHLARVCRCAGLYVCSINGRSGFCTDGQATMPCRRADTNSPSARPTMGPTPAPTVLSTAPTAIRTENPTRPPTAPPASSAPTVSPQDYPTIRYSIAGLDVQDFLENQLLASEQRLRSLFIINSGASDSDLASVMLIPSLARPASAEVVFWFNTAASGSSMTIRNVNDLAQTSIGSVSIDGATYNLGAGVASYTSSMMMAQMAQGRADRPINALAAVTPQPPPAAPLNFPNVDFEPCLTAADFKPTATYGSVCAKISNDANFGASCRSAGGSPNSEICRGVGRSACRQVRGARWTSLTCRDQVNAFKDDSTPVCDVMPSNFMGRCCQPSREGTYCTPTTLAPDASSAGDKDDNDVSLIVAVFIIVLLVIVVLGCFMYQRFNNKLAAATAAAISGPTSGMYEQNGAFGFSSVPPTPQQRNEQLFFQAPLEAHARSPVLSHYMDVSPAPMTANMIGFLADDDSEVLL